MVVASLCCHNALSGDTLEDINDNDDQTEGNGTRPQNNNANTKLFSIAELDPCLLLCGASALRGNCLSQLGITCLISAAPELPPLPLPPTVKHHYTINIKDTSSSNISPHLDAVADIIDRVQREGGKTLVHCVAGVSRSASLCLGYLVKYKNMSLREAYEHVHRLRPCIRPNSGFFTQLIQFEKDLTDTTTVEMVFNSAAKGVIPDVYEPDYYNTMRYNNRCYGIK